MKMQIVMNKIVDFLNKLIFGHTYRIVKMDVLGRENNLNAFLRHISERNAALWRWKRTNGSIQTTTEDW